MQAWHKNLGEISGIDRLRDIVVYDFMMDIEKHIPEMITYSEKFIDFRSPSWRTISRIQKILDKCVDIYCDNELRVIVTSMAVDDIILLKLSGYFENV